MPTVNDRMKEDCRRIYAKVEVIYTDPFIDESTTATATETGRYTYADQVNDLVDVPDYKYFSLHTNKLDGTFHPLPENVSHGESVGWWGTHLSDANGNLSPVPTITLSFDARAIFFLKVTGDSLLNEFPVNFVIKLYTGSTVVYTETVVNNDKVFWTKDIEDIGSITKIELTITKINKPFVVPKVLEFYTTVSESYDGDRVIEMNLLEEQVFDDMTLPIGNVSTNEIDIRFDNTDKHFDPRNMTSPLFGQLKKNRKVKPYLGVDIEGQGNVTYFPLGVFYTTDWKAPTNDIYASCTARDRLELLKQKEFTSSLVYQNKSVYDMAQMIFFDFGLTFREFIIDESLKSLVIPYMWFDRVTHREALAQLAEASLSRLYCDRTGMVRFEAQRTTSGALFEFTDNDTIFSADYPLASGQIANYVETVSNPRTIAAAATTIYQSSETIWVPANGISKQTFKFSFVPCVQVQTPVIAGASGITIQSWTAYAWGVVVTFKNSNPTIQGVTSVTVSGKQLNIVGASVASAQDAKSISDNGKITFKIENDFIQTSDRANSISGSILAAYKDARHDIELETRGHITLQLGDKIKAPAFVEGTTADYFIVRQETNWDGSLDAKIKGLKV